MLVVILFVVCLLASSVGAVVGAGGGVIIKPVLDMIGVLPVSTVSFCSGCTVLGMSVCSLIRTRKNGVKLQVRTSTALAIGAVFGGLIGKWLFDLVRTTFRNENVLGAIQAICLAIVTIGVLVYVCKKDTLPSKNVKNMGAIIFIGLFLGLISAFLGIGGGPANVAVLFFFFSMDAKEAAKNSLYIIIFSQLSSVISAVATASVPAFEWHQLIGMVLGGVSGGLVGAYISSKIDNKGVEKILKWMMVLIIALCIYNAVKYII